MTDDGLFDASLLTASSTTSLPSNLILRPLQRDDYGRGYRSILEPLMDTPQTLTEETYRERFHQMQTQSPQTYYILVLVDTSLPPPPPPPPPPGPLPAATPTDEQSKAQTPSREERGTTVGTATVLRELKFLRGGVDASHIEDVVIAPSHQGQKLGKVLIDACVELSRALDCYKIILDCSPQNTGFYEKCGFQQKGIEMKLYL